FSTSISFICALSLHDALPIWVFMARMFYPIESYSTSKPGYRLLPFRFLRLDSKSELLVNEVGEFVIAPLGTVRALIEKQLAPGSDRKSTRLNSSHQIISYAVF